jgi:hypothetical protein
VDVEGAVEEEVDVRGDDERGGVVNVELEVVDVDLVVGELDND